MHAVYYFDNNATTCVSRNVSRAMSETNYYTYGNPSSIYTFGIESKQKIEAARQKVAELFDGNKENIIFTSGATEANNTVIHSALIQNQHRKRIIISSVEHPSVHTYVEYYKNLGYDIISIPVKENGIDINYIENALNSDTALVSLMSVNNETGMIFPIDDIFYLVKKYDRKIICHSDCVQAVGKVAIPIKYADYLTISAHKFHGPKGIGCIYKRESMDFHPFIYGGGQEGGNRSGTENISCIVGMGIAAQEIGETIAAKDYIKQLQNKLEKELSRVDSYVVCADTDRVAGVTNVGFRNVEANQMLLKLNQKGIFVSTGSACSAKKIGNSRIIEELGVPIDYRSTIRISMSKYTTEDEVDYLIQQIVKIVKHVESK